MELFTSYFAGMYDNIVKDNVAQDWSDVIQEFTKHRVTDQKNDVGVIFSKFKTVAQGAEAAVIPSKTDKTVKIPLKNTVRRTASNVIEVNALVIDYDGGAKIADVKAQLSEIEHLGYTSYNHLKDGRTEKFRVIAPLKTPCPADEWVARRKSLLEMFPGCDLTTFALARIFYTPTAPEDGHPEAWFHEGTLFDWTEIQPEVIVPRSTTVRSGSKTGSGRVLPETVNLFDLFTEEGLEPELIDKAANKYRVWCPNQLEHSDPSKKSGTVIWSGIQGSRDGFYCAHSHCQGKFITSLFSDEAIAKHCERDDDGLVLITKEKLDEPVEKRETARPDARQFEELHTWDRRKKNVEAARRTVGRTSQHLVFQSPEGYGKSTETVRQELEAGNSVLFCCSSNAQAAAKMEDFKEYKPGRWVSLGGLLQEHFGIAPIYKEREDEWSAAVLDEEETVLLISTKLECSIEEATEALNELRDKAAASRDDESQLVITTFALGSMVYNSKVGRLGRTVIVDDASTSDLLTAKFDFEGEDLVQVAEREVGECIFGEEFKFGDRVIWTTTEQNVTGIIKRQHPGAAIYNIKQNLGTGNNVGLYTTELTRAKTKFLLGAMHEMIIDETNEKICFMADGATSKDVNLVSSKGRNDLTGQSVIVVSYPHPCEVAAVTESLGRPETDRYAVMVQMIIDKINQALGRGHGYRADGSGSLLLCDPQLAVMLKFGSRYEIKDPAKMKTSKFVGAFIFDVKPYPFWFNNWKHILDVWHENVFETNDGRIVNLSGLKFAQSGLSKKEQAAISELLNKPLKNTSSFWKKVEERLEPEEGRKNFVTAIEELANHEQEVIKSGLKERAKKAGSSTKKPRPVTCVHVSQPANELKLFPGDVCPIDYKIKCKGKFTLSKTREIVRS